MPPPDKPYLVHLDQPRFYWQRTAGRFATFAEAVARMRQTIGRPYRRVDLWRIEHPNGDTMWTELDWRVAPPASAELERAWCEAEDGDISMDRPWIAD